MQPDENNKKDKLILIFMREVKSLFLRINKENSKHIITTGNPVSAEKFSSDWESLLKKHYDRVQTSFKGEVEKHLPKEEQGFSKLETSIMVSFLLDWGDKNSKRNANEIVKTTSKQLLSSVEKARNIVADQQLPTDDFTLAFTTAALFRRMFDSRVSKIAVFSTQGASESSKIAEAIVLGGGEPKISLNPIIPTANTVIKKWNDSRDDKVRDLHVLLHGVKKKISEPFFSGGEQLMYPTDTSLGATAKNIMRCRCYLTFEILRIRR